MAVTVTLNVRLKGGWLEAENGKEYLVVPGQAGTVISTAAQKIQVQTHGIPESPAAPAANPAEPTKVEPTKVETIKVVVSLEDLLP